MLQEQVDLLNDLMGQLLADPPTARLVPDYDYCIDVGWGVLLITDAVFDNTIDKVTRKLSGYTVWTTNEDNELSEEATVTSFVHASTIAVNLISQELVDQWEKKEHQKGRAAAWTKMTNNAFQDGYQAYLDGKSDTINPYKTLSAPEMTRRWQAGYNEAEKDAERQERDRERRMED